VSAELDVVRLRRDLRGAGLARGQSGTIHAVQARPPPHYLVAFCDAQGRAPAIVPVAAEDLALQWSRQAHQERPA
jgi:hypothetical protein